MKIPHVLDCWLIGILGISAPVAFGQDQSPEVKIAINLGGVAGTMRGGIGASWHAIENPIPVRGGTSDGGSAWGLYDLQTRSRGSGSDRRTLSRGRQLILCTRAEAERWWRLDRACRRTMRRAGAA